MKRLSVPILLFILACPAQAGLHIWVNGEPPDSEIYVLPSDTLNLGIFADPGEHAVWTLILAVDGPGQIEGHTMIYPKGYYEEDPVLIDIRCLTLGLGCGWDDASYMEFVDISSHPDPLEGLVVTDIIFHCEAPGDVTLWLLDGATREPFDIVTIHQVTDPPRPIAEAHFTGIFLGVPPAGSNWTINPIDPNTTNIISFSGHTRPYSNDCYFYRATQDLPPILTVSYEARAIEMSFHTDPSMFCIDLWDPLYGSIEGEFGPLSAGDWRFFSDDPYTTFSIQFTVYSGKLFVNATQGSDTNNGISAETAFATIQKAIDTAIDGDTITVAPGTYTENINFLGKNITLTSSKPTESSTVKNTTIDGFVRFRGTEDPNCTLTGFNINESVIGRDWEIDPEGKNHTRATISHCILENIATGCGGVIQACDGVISNCIIANTIYGCARPWPVPAIVGCHGLIKNCTMVNMYDGIEIGSGGTCTMENCILYDSSPILVPTGATLNVSYCDIYSPSGIAFVIGTVNWGPGNNGRDPCFVRVGTWGDDGDYHLKSQAGWWDADEEQWTTDETTSPCIDAGDPTRPIGLEPFPNGGIINMGAYGGTAEASKSYFGKPPCETIIAGDVNGDCAVDMRDFWFISLHWMQDSSP